MRRTVLPISALLLATAVMYLAAGQQGILIPVRAGIEGFSATSIGFFGAAYATGFVAGCYVIPLALRRVGHIRTFAVVAVMSAVGILLMGIWTDGYVWLAMRAVSGFSVAGAAMIIESWLNDRATNENRGTVFSTYMVVYLSAVTAGQMSLMMFDPAAVTMFVVAGVFFALALIPTSLTLMPAPTPPARANLHVGWLYNVSPVGTVGAFMIGLANGAFGTLGPVYAQDVGFDVAGIAIFVSIALVAGAAAQWPLGRLSDSMDRRLVIASVSVVGLLAGLALYFFAMPGWVTFVLIAAFGLAAYSLYGLVVAHANDFADPAEFVAVSSGLLMMFGFGSIIGPIIAAALAEVMTTAGIFVFTAAAHLALAAFAFYRIGQRKPVSEEEKETFVGLARATSPAAAAMDPRAEEDQVEDPVAEEASGTDAGGEAKA